jgi:hypothetical protein
MSAGFRAGGCAGGRGRSAPRARPGRTAPRKRIGRLLLLGMGLAAGGCDRAVHVVGAADPLQGAGPGGARGVAEPLPDPTEGTEAWWTWLEPDWIATRLSLLLLQQYPTPELIARVKANPPRSPVEIGVLSRELLRSNGGVGVSLQFAVQWLGVPPEPPQKDPASFPGFRPLYGDLRLQLLHYAWRLLDADAQIATLLEEVPLNRTVAPLYRVVEPSAPFVWHRHLEPPLDHAGLLTLPVLMALASGPIEHQPSRRGQWLASRFLCLDWSSNHPPTTLPPIPGATVRQRLAAATTDIGCGDCHARVDALGAAFDHFDAEGGYRDEEAGQPVDASGLLTIAERPLPFEGARGLARLMLTDPELRFLVERCYVAQWLAFAIGRSEVATSYAGELDVSYAHARASASGSFRLRDVIAAVTETRLFWFVR